MKLQTASVKRNMIIIDHYQQFKVHTKYTVSRGQKSKLCLETYMDIIH